MKYNLRSYRSRSMTGCLELAGAISGRVRNGSSMSTDGIRAAPSKYKADVWVQFGFKNKPGSMDLDKANAVCKFCHAAIDFSGNTTTLWTHLVRHHANTKALLQQPKPVDARQTTLNRNGLSSTSSRGPKFTESAVHIICHNLHLYNVIENTGFRYMINTMEPRYVTPTHKQITEVAVPRIYEEVEQIVKTSLFSAERMVAGSRGPLSLMLRSHRTTSMRKLISYVLQTGENAWEPYWQ